MSWRKALIRAAVTAVLFLILMFIINDYRGVSQDGLVLSASGFFVGMLVFQRFGYPRLKFGAKRRV